MSNPVVIVDATLEQAAQKALAAINGLWRQKAGGGLHIDGASAVCVLELQSARNTLIAALEKPTAWTTYAHIHATDFGKSGLFVKKPGGPFCVPVFFGEARHIQEPCNDPT